MRSTMTSLQSVLCVTCLLLGKMVQKIHLTSSPTVNQDCGFKSMYVGDNITLQCFYGHTTLLFWYMQPLGEKPKLISTFYVYGKVMTFHDKFKNDSRFTLDTKHSNGYHLTISDLKLSDSATYYCAVSAGMVLTFAEGATVSVKSSGFNIRALVHQSASETIQPGDSPWRTLNCAVHNVKCDAEENVYWFKDSQEAHPGLIYAHGGWNDQCERKDNTHSNTCSYNLPKKNLNVSHAETNYCAVASCRHALFGNKTKLDSSRDAEFHLLYFLTGALIFSTILAVLLIITLYNMNRSTSTEARCPAAPTSGTVSKNQDADSPQYAALELNQRNRSRRQKSDATSDCVYSRVKQQD